MLEKIRITADGEFSDSEGNIIQLRGVNLDPNIKIPRKPHYTTHTPIDGSSFFDDAGDVSFVGHPFCLEEVESHIKRLASLGYNTIRYCFTWESLEHEGPGIYDQEYIDYTIQVLKKIHQVGGMYIYLDPHQDVWSRFTGGSGAPVWTLHCAGFQPKRFQDTEASILHNYYIDPKTGNEATKYPKMLWPTNYYRLASQTMFTLFFGGKYFAPKCRINGENIQDYLQSKYIDAVMTLYKNIRDNAPELFEENCLIGMETLNEPNAGYFNVPDLSQIPKDRNLKKGTSPTSFQSFQLGEGIATVVDVYDISIFGPRKTGKKLIDPRGTCAWLTTKERDAVDAKYGWKRAEEWEPEKCIWRQHGVWEVKNDKEGNIVGAELLLPEYFHVFPKTREFIDENYFTNHFFVEHYTEFRRKFRDLDEEGLLFLQPPVLKEPPKLLGSNLLDHRTVYSCHFYDGMSLMFKTWNRMYNVDTFGIMRGKYINPIFSLVFGESNIRKCIRKQLKEMKEEGKQLLGAHIPVFFTEIGMPFDMEDKKAYKDGDYNLQTSAMDALGFSLEGNNLSFSLWCYCHENSHQWGDMWNNEDFSIWSSDGRQKSTQKITLGTVNQENFTSNPLISMSSTNSVPPSQAINDVVTLDYSGFRALDATLRPYPIKIHGKFEYAEFDLSSKVYTLRIYCSHMYEPLEKPSNPNTGGTSLIFLPRYHFPLEDISVRSSSGRFVYVPKQQVLKWHHEYGHQFITIENINKNGERVSSNESSPSVESDDCSIM